MLRENSIALAVLVFMASAAFLALAAVCTRPMIDVRPASRLPSAPSHPANGAQVTTSQPAAHRVTIDNFSFQPQTLSVPSGSQVTWINHDDVPHTATSVQKPRAFESGVLDTDETFSHRFDTPGTYDYFCAVHPHMTGRIIVN